MPAYRQLSENEFFLLNAALDLYTPDLNELPHFYAEFRDVLVRAICEYPKGKLLIRDKGGSERWAVMQYGDIYLGITPNLQEGVPLFVLRRLGTKLKPLNWGRFIKRDISIPSFFLAFAIWALIKPVKPIEWLPFGGPWVHVVVAATMVIAIVGRTYSMFKETTRQNKLSRSILEHFTQKTEEEKQTETERFAGKQPKF